MCTNVSVAPAASTIRANYNLERVKFSVRIAGDQAETRSDHLPIHATSIQVKVKFTLEEVMKAQRGSRGTALFFP